MIAEEIFLADVHAVAKMKHLPQLMSYKIPKFGAVSMETFEYGDLLVLNVHELTVTFSWKIFTDQNSVILRKSLKLSLPQFPSLHRHNDLTCSHIIKINP